jgi:hypothetical protein
MQVETEPKKCASPFCRYPAHFDVTDAGIEQDEYCSPVCGQLMRYVRVAASIEDGPVAERLSRILVETAEMLNGRGSDPREPNPVLASRVFRHIEQAL